MHLLMIMMMMWWWWWQLEPSFLVQQLVSYFQCIHFGRSLTSTQAHTKHSSVVGTQLRLVDGGSQGGVLISSQMSILIGRQLKLFDRMSVWRGSILQTPIHININITLHTHTNIELSRPWSDSSPWFDPGKFPPNLLANPKQADIVVW